MSLEKAAETVGLEFDRDVPTPIRAPVHPKTGHRRLANKRDTARMIGLARKMERDRDQEMFDLLGKIQKLTEENATLRADLQTLRLIQRLSELNIAEKDRKFLLEGPKPQAVA